MKTNLCQVSLITSEIRENAILLHANVSIEHELHDDNIWFNR